MSCISRTMTIYLNRVAIDEQKKVHGEMMPCVSYGENPHRLSYSEKIRFAKVKLTNTQDILLQSKGSRLSCGIVQVVGV